MRSIQPTNQNPIVLPPDFILYENQFEYQSVKYALADVKSLFYSASKSSINCVSLHIDYMLVISYGKTPDESVTLSSTSALFTTKKGKAIQSIHAYLSKKTFNQRFNVFKEELKMNGSVDVNGITVFKNGNVFDEDTTLNLGEAAKEGNLYFGTDFRIGTEGKTNPYEILITNGKIFKRKEISIKTHFDRDVITALIKEITNNCMATQ